MAHWGDDGGGGWRYQISNLEIKIVTFLDYCIYIYLYIFFVVMIIILGHAFRDQA